jgi:hypothetical protein
MILQEARRIGFMHVVESHSPLENCEAPLLKPSKILEAPRAVESHHPAEPCQAPDLSGA